MTRSPMVAASQTRQEPRPFRQPSHPHGRLAAGDAGEMSSLSLARLSHVPQCSAGGHRIWQSLGRVLGESPKPPQETWFRHETGERRS